MSSHALPQFSKLNLDTFQENLERLLQTNLAKIDALLEQKPFNWINLMRPLEDMEDELERLWSPLSHLHAVVNSPALRECYQACLPKLSMYQTEIGQNAALYEAINSLDKLALSPVQEKIVDDMLQDFVLSGVALPYQQKERFKAIQTRLSDLANQFENNVLDATQAFSLHVDDEKQLQGLPSHALDTAKALAVEKGLSGWVLNLEFPCYLAVIMYADDRQLRETFYHAYTTRASDEGPHAGQFDNSAIIDELLALRHEEATLLGYANYAELSLAKKMAASTTQVIDFLMDLANRAYPQAQADINNLQAFALSKFNVDTLKPWDISYFAEKMREAYYQLSQETLRPYFPVEKVLNGLFTIIHRLYGIHLEKVMEVDTWHPDVMCYRLLDDDLQERGFIYIDLFARPNKRGGAWMDSCQSRRRLADGSIQLPIATLTCNFASAADNSKATLSHDEVLTLFHECGHCLHHLLTQVDYINVSGIHGVEWDAVELPSQFFENWGWEFDALGLLTEHIDDKEPLPLALYESMIAAKNFHSAMAMMRQLEFSLFDFRLHGEYSEQIPQFVATLLEEIRAEISVVPSVHYNRFQHSFSHIFAGGYAAGYYSYKWAEVLSSDAYARFEEEGIFNENTGRDFLRCILEVGGSKAAADAFIAFRGRPAQVDALLRHNGIIP